MECEKLTWNHSLPLGTVVRLLKLLPAGLHLEPVNYFDTGCTTVSCGGFFNTKQLEVRERVWGTWG